MSSAMSSKIPSKVIFFWDLNRIFLRNFEINLWNPPWNPSKTSSDILPKTFSWIYPGTPFGIPPETSCRIPLATTSENPAKTFPNEVQKQLAVTGTFFCSQFYESLKSSVRLYSGIPTGTTSGNSFWDSGNSFKNFFRDSSRNFFRNTFKKTAFILLATPCRDQDSSLDSSSSTVSNSCSSPKETIRKNLTSISRGFPKQLQKS